VVLEFMDPHCVDICPIVDPRSQDFACQPPSCWLTARPDSLA
jgi:hypothetical protein